MYMFTVLNRDYVVLMLFWEDFTILDGLYRCVIVILVHLTIDGGGSLFVALLDDFLLHNSGSDLLMYSGVMMTSLVPESERVSAIQSRILQ